MKKKSTRCLQGYHVLCSGKAGVGKDCECECHEKVRELVNA
jgi:hypothetical protein